jgi:hypothetical protein
MPRVGFEPMIPASKRAKTVHALDHSATVTGRIFFFFNLCGGTFGSAATTGLLYQSWMIGDGDRGEIGGIKIGRGTRSTRRKPPSSTLSTINPTWLDPGLNPGRRGGKPATNRLSYGAADRQNLSLQTDNHSGDNKVPSFFRTQRFITVFRSARQWVSSIQRTSLQIIFLRFIVIFSHQWLGFLTNLDFQNKMLQDGRLKC